MWTIKREGERAALEIEPLERLSKTAKGELMVEGTKLLKLLDEGGRDLRIRQPR
ncbi:MAG: hypothetical protein M3P43_11900 [Actinomycetota bacterium]|nr:hypothetical protein [Actinomycetota bacterium]